jgi:hypothetical protein
MIMMQQSFVRPRRIRAALIGLGLDCYDEHNRLTRGDQSLVFGGSAETHDALRETVLRMELELDRQGRRLGDLGPLELAELAWRIDSPELHEIALRLEAGLEQQGRAFEELSAEELTALLAPEGSTWRASAACVDTAQVGYGPHYCGPSEPVRTADPTGDA